MHLLLSSAIFYGVLSTQSCFWSTIKNLDIKYNASVHYIHTCISRNSGDDGKNFFVYVISSVGSLGIWDDDRVNFFKGIMRKKSLHSPWSFDIWRRLVCITLRYFFVVYYPIFLHNLSETFIFFVLRFSLNKGSSKWIAMQGLHKWLFCFFLW